MNTMQAQVSCTIAALFAFAILIQGGCGDAKAEEVSCLSYRTDAPAESRFSKEAAIEALKRKATILASFTAVEGDHWAGQYYRGDGLADNDYLAISPSGFVFETYGCDGLNDRNYGDAISSSGVIALRGEYPFEDDGFTELEGEYVPVAWGERAYLVESHNIVSFCNAINAGHEPRKGIYGDFFMKDADDEHAAFGQPHLPSGFERYILHEPVDARLVRLQESLVSTNRYGVKVTDIDAVIDKGRRDGIYPGMDLYRRNDRDLITATVIDSAEDSAIVRFRYYGADIVQPSSGWSLGTSWPD